VSNKYDSMGFVSLEDLTNVFTMKQDEMSSKIFPHLVHVEARCERAMIQDFFDTIRLELQKRAKGNLDAYLRLNPAVKKEERQAKADEAADKNKAAYESRIKMGRSIAGL